MTRDYSHQLFLYLLVLFSIALLGWNNVIELRAEEPRRAVVTMEMIMSGNYWVPKLNGWIYYNKPPLFNWVMAIFFKLFQSYDEWVVRLPGILSLLSTAGILIVYGKKHLSNTGAWIAALLLICSADLLFYGTVNAGEIDLFYMLLVFLQGLCIFHFTSKRKFTLLFLYSYTLCALGFLTKGPPSLVFQALTLGGWLIFTGNWHKLFNWRHLLGIVVFLFITGTYFVMYENHGYNASDFLIRLMKESSQRTAAESSMPAILGQFITFPARLLILLFPGSIFLYLLIRKDFKSLIRKYPIVLFSVFFIIVNIPLYWLTGDFKARYLYPFFPFFCLVFAGSWHLMDESSIKRKRYLTVLMGVLMCTFLIAFVLLPFFDYSKMIPFLTAKLISICISLGFLIIIFFRYPGYRLISFLAVFLVLRMAFNMCYFPTLIQQSNSLKYREITDQILTLTQEESVHFYGTAQMIDSDIKIGGRTLISASQETSAPMAYQIPYYLMKENAAIVRFEEDLREDQFYLAQKRMVKDLDIDIYFEFIEGWVNWKIVLFKLK